MAVGVGYHWGKHAGVLVWGWELSRKLSSKETVALDLEGPVAVPKKRKRLGRCSRLREKPM